MNRVILFTLLLTFTVIAKAEQVVAVSCPGQAKSWLPKAKIDRVGALAGTGDFLPIIEHSEKINARSLYKINGTVRGADYLAAVIWSASLNKLGVNCYPEIQNIYKTYTGKELTGYYVEAVKAGLKRD